MRFPNSLEELNATWLTEVLSAGFPGTEVTHAVIGSVIRGTATKARVMLDYNDAGHAHGLPTTLWFKGGLEAHSVAEHMVSVYAAEARFYRDLAPKLNLTLPRCYFVHVDPKTGRSVILLEDMLARNARFGYATRPATPKLAASVLEQLARLHGAFWESDFITKNETFMSAAETVAAFVRELNFGRDNWNRCLKLPRGQFVKGELADRDFMDEIVQRMLAEDRARATGLVHGDAHHGNVCILPGERASYLDWQAVMAGFWAHDVSYFLTAALTIDDRRRHERDLINHYVAELTQAGGKLDEATAWLEYRRHALYTFCWFPCYPEWQPEEVTASNTERAVVAMADLDTMACWR
ncbi:MAG: phosphotransferase [Steroidobacteraceae bacterium]